MLLSLLISTPKKGFLFLLLLISLEAYSQKIIPRIGMSFARTSRGTDMPKGFTIDLKYKPGFLAGVGIEFPISKCFSFQPELVYVQKGEKIETLFVNEGLYYHAWSDMSVRFAELPLILKATLGNGNVKYNFQLGTMIGYALKGSVDYQVENMPGVIGYTQSYQYDFSKSENGQDDYPHLGKRLDFGFQAGVGVMFFEKIILDIRYSQGMVEFMYYVEKDESYKNKVIQISIGVPIALKKEN